MVKIDPILNTSDHLRTEDAPFGNWRNPVPSLASLPLTGNLGDLIMTSDTGLVYQWNGVAWVQFGAVPAGTVSGTGLTVDTIILGNGLSTIKTSSKTIATTLGTDDTTVPTSKAVKDVTDTKASKGFVIAMSVSL